MGARGFTEQPRATALCRRAAEAGGSLRIESVPGFGTAVTFEAPVTPP